MNLKTGLAEHKDNLNNQKKIKKVILPLRYMENKKEFLKVLETKNSRIK